MSESVVTRLTLERNVFWFYRVAVGRIRVDAWRRGLECEVLPSISVSAFREAARITITGPKEETASLVTWLKEQGFPEPEQLGERRVRQEGA